MRWEAKMKIKVAFLESVLFILRAVSYFKGLPRPRTIDG